MRLGIQLGYSGEGFAAAAEEVVEFEAAGADLVVVPEAYSFDAVSQLGYLAARTSRMQLASGVMQLYTRTPTLTAMTAAGIDYVSGGRFSLGLGASGPQVIEGFHGVAYDAPLARTREVVEICRRVWRREVLVHEGAHYRIPLPADAGTGLGKPLKLINRPVRDRIPILLAAMGPRNVALAAELAEGWQPIHFVPDRFQQVWGDALAAGRAKRSADLPPLQIMAGGNVALGSGPDVTKAREATRGNIGFYVGGMGAREKNFYNELFQRYGWVDEAKEIQDLFLSGRREEAIAAVPDEYVDLATLAGDPGYVRERIAVYKSIGVTYLNITVVGEEPLKIFEQVKAWAD